MTAGGGRVDGWFSSAGVRCAAWVYRPAAPGPVPCVVLAHGFGVTRDAGLDAYARRFVAAGLAAVVFDYRFFGASAGSPRQVVDVGAQLADWAAAVEFARGLPGVDAGRIALWGSSFSGGHVVRVAAADPRIAAVVSQVPYLGLVRRRAVPNRRTVVLAARSVADSVRAWCGARPLCVPILGDPGSAALLQAPGAAEQFRTLLPVGSPWVNSVAARIVVRLPGYRPGAAAGSVRCPVLFCSCSRDEITPAALVRVAASAAPRGELIEYEGEHFQIYGGALFERAVADQVRFLVGQLAA